MEPGMKISKGLYEVLSSTKTSLEDRCEAIRRFSTPIHHLDGEFEGMIEAPEIAEEDAELLIHNLKIGNVRTWRGDIE